MNHPAYGARQPRRRTRRTAGLALCVAAITAVVACTPPPAADWTAVGGSVTSSGTPPIAVTQVNASGDPVVATVSGSTLSVSTWTGSSWAKLGAKLNTGTSPWVMQGGMALDATGSPIVAWTDGGSGYVARWSGSAWQAVGAPVANVFDEDLYIASATPLTIGYLRSTGVPPAGRQLIVASWTGSAWTTLAPRVLPNYTVGYPLSVTLDESGNPIVAWQGLRATGGSGDWDLVVERYSGGAWSQLGGVLNVNPLWGASGAEVQAAAGTITVSWIETAFRQPFFTYVKQWTGTGWQQLGGAVGQTIGSPYATLVVDGFGRPIVASQVNNTDLAVQTWDGSGWVAVGGIPNPVADGTPLGPFSLGRSGSTLALSWIGPPGSGYAVYVSRLVMSSGQA